VPEAPASDCFTGSPAPRLTDVAGRAPDFHPFRAARQGHERLLQKPDGGRHRQPSLWLAGLAAGARP
jgi:hypothetical protein